MPEGVGQLRDLPENPVFHLTLHHRPRGHGPGQCGLDVAHHDVEVKRTPVATETTQVLTRSRAALAFLQHIERHRRPQQFRNARSQSTSDLKTQRIAVKLQSLFQIRHVQIDQQFHHHGPFLVDKIQSFAGKKWRHPEPAP